MFPDFLYDIIRDGRNTKYTNDDVLFQIQEWKCKNVHKVWNKKDISIKMDSKLFSPRTTEECGQILAKAN